jgi:excinuclease UvrABC nuclease subunit
MVLPYRNLTRPLLCTYCLDDIPGIGPKRLKTIWQAFSSLEELPAAESEEIAEKAKIPLEVAEKIRERARGVSRKN